MNIIIKVKAILTIFWYYFPTDIFVYLLIQIDLLFSHHFLRKPSNHQASINRDNDTRLKMQYNNSLFECPKFYQSTLVLFSISHLGCTIKRSLVASKIMSMFWEMMMSHIFMFQAILKPFIASALHAIRTYKHSFSVSIQYGCICCRVIYGSH